MNYEFEPTAPCDNCDEDVSFCSQCEHSLQYAVNTEEIEKAFNASVNVDVKTILEIAAQDLHRNVAHRIHSYIINKTKEEFEKCFRDNWSQESFKEVLKKVIREKLEETYPDIVENKVNELAEMIKKIDYKDKNDKIALDIHQRSTKIVNDYIEKELSITVKKTKEEIDEFAKNYFTRNLFRAMGMMDQFTNTMQVEKKV